MCKDKEIDRRKVMKWIVAGVGAATTGILGIPAVITSLSPTIKYTGKEKWTALGKFERFPIGDIVPVKVRPRLERDFMALTLPKDVFVWRKDLDEVVIYSRSCTDLGCPVNFDVGSECFFCPCHGGIFSKEGEVMAGPPKSPLHRYSYRILDGFLEIDLASIPIVA
jgi:menaquinol-cytochrome c reductase iron-sulfur subunit